LGKSLQLFADHLAQGLLQRPGGLKTLLTRGIAEQLQPPPTEGLLRRLRQVAAEPPAALSVACFQWADALAGPRGPLFYLATAQLAFVATWLLSTRLAGYCEQTPVRRLFRALPA
jgi:hypothetical protein